MSTPGLAVPGTPIPAGSLVSPGGGQGIGGTQGPQGPQGPAGASTPTGCILEFAGSAAPTGWLLCDGSAVNRTTYSALYTTLGGASSPWGQGDGSTTFNVPDLRGRVSVGAGQGSSLTNRVLAATGGEEAHTLVTAELASHTHTATQGTHTHTDSGHGHTATSTQGTHTHTDAGHVHAQTGYTAFNTSGILLTQTAQAWTISPNNTASGTAVISTVSAGAITTTVASGNAAISTVSAGAITIGNNGSGTAHNTMPPFVILNKIIKT